MTMTPNFPAQQNSAIGLLFGPAEIATGSLAILSEAADVDLGRALENLPPVVRATAVKEVKAAAADLLEVNVVDMLIAGWRKYHDLTSAARRTLDTPGSTELVRMVTHRVTAEQQPYIKVLIDGHPVATVHLKLSLDFDVSALLAGISAGRLVAVHAGRCDITAALAVDGVDVVSRQASLDLPGVIPVTPGIRLLPAEDYPPSAGQPRATPSVGPAKQAQPKALGGAPAASGRTRLERQGGRWSKAAEAATRAATPVSPSAGRAVPSAPQAGASEKTGPSREWWEQ